MNTSCSEDWQNSVVLESSMKSDKLAKSENQAIDCEMPFEKAKIIENFRNDQLFQFEEDDSRPNSSRILYTSRTSERSYASSSRPSHEIIRNQEINTKKPSTLTDKSPLLITSQEEDFNSTIGSSKSHKSEGGKPKYEYKPLVRFDSGECFFQTIRQELLDKPE